MKVKQQPKKPSKAYIGVFIPSSLKDELKAIARMEKRSLNAQTEIFLLAGVQHLDQKRAA
jgi:hypothetical protein